MSYSESYKHLKKNEKKKKRDSNYTSIAIFVRIEDFISSYIGIKSSMIIRIKSECASNRTLVKDQLKKHDEDSEFNLKKIGRRHVEKGPTQIRHFFILLHTLVKWTS